MRAAALEIQFAKGAVHMGGVTSVRVSFCLFPLCQNTPPSNQEEPGKTLPSVKLENPNLPGFGTVPFVLALFHHRQLPSFGFTDCLAVSSRPRLTPHDLWASPSLPRAEPGTELPRPARGQHTTKCYAFPVFLKIRETWFRRKFLAQKTLGYLSLGMHWRHFDVTA